VADGFIPIQIVMGAKLEEMKYMLLDERQKTADAVGSPVERRQGSRSGAKSCGPAPRVFRRKIVSDQNLKRAKT
jgi:hypothetical protein